MVWLQVVGIFNVRVQMLKHVIVHGGCTDTVRESALKVDSGRKVPYRAGNPNPRQYCLAFQSDALPSDLSPLLKTSTHSPSRSCDYMTYDQLLWEIKDCIVKVEGLIAQYMFQACSILI